MGRPTYRKKVGLFIDTSMEKQRNDFWRDTIGKVEALGIQCIHEGKQEERERIVKELEKVFLSNSDYNKGVQDCINLVTSLK